MWAPGLKRAVKSLSKRACELFINCCAHFLKLLFIALLYFFKGRLNFLILLFGHLGILFARCVKSCRHFTINSCQLLLIGFGKCLQILADLAYFARNLISLSLSRVILLGAVTRELVINTFLKLVKLFVIFAVILVFFKRFDP